MATKASSTATLRGTGPGPTKGEVQAWWALIPATATLDFKTESADRPGEMSGWRITATWDIPFGDHGPIEAGGDSR